MNEPYVEEFRARWADIDYNQHMRNAAYLGCSEECRVRFLEKQGWTMDKFMKHRIGPVVLEEHLIYKKELKPQEAFRVDLSLAGMTSDGRRFKIRNRFFRAQDGALCAVVDSVALWFDLSTRKPLNPVTPDLRDIWLSLPRTEDFQALI